jgi:hypothetical protein
MIDGKKVDQKLIYFNSGEAAFAQKAESSRRYFEVWILPCFSIKNSKGKYYLEEDEVMYKNMRLFKARTNCNGFTPSPAHQI